MQRPTGTPCAAHVLLNPSTDASPSSSVFASADVKPAQLADIEEESDHAPFQVICRFKHGPWTPAEDDRLRELVSTRTTSREIALMLNRTLSAVRARARVIDVQLSHASQVGACRRHRRAASPSSNNRPGIAYRIVNHFQLLQARADQ